MPSLKMILKKTLFISFRILTIGFYVLFFFALISIFIPPHYFWIAGTAALFIPFFVFCNIIFLIFFVFRKSSFKWTALTFLILSSFYFFFLYRIPAPKNKNQGYDFKLLSYNISGYGKRHQPKVKHSIADYIIGKDPDIVCLQEYFNDSTSLLDSIYPYHIIEAKEKLIGVAIFSKYPILNKGIVFEGKSGFNKGVFADVMIKDKTVRVISVHLESNGLRRGNPFISIKKIAYNIGALKSTSGIRSLQARKLISFMDTTRYPVIVAGDFNEPPYSYVYFKMRTQFKNSFEERGSGFGFTFLSQKTLLRIDHHFTNDLLKAEDYATFPEVKLSDHAPVAGTYSFTK